MVATGPFEPLAQAILRDAQPLLENSGDAGLEAVRRADLLLDWCHFIVLSRRK
jgi:hypothetical protein